MLTIGSNINEVRVDGSLKALVRDLDAFAGLGLTAAEISIHGLDTIRNGRCNKPRIRELQAILADYPFAYSTHAPNPLNLMDRDDPDLHRDVLFASLECSAEIGARVMVYHPGRYLAEEAFSVVSRPCILTPREKQAMLDHEAVVLAQAADHFPGVVIAMENARPYLCHSPYCYAENPSELVSQIRRIGKANVGMTLDFGHLHLASRFYGFDEREEVRQAAPDIVHCHVHDNFGRSVYHTEKIQTHQIPFGRGDAHMPVGWGNIPFGDLFSYFISDYSGILICELRSRYFDDTGEAAENLRRILEGSGLVDRQNPVELSCRNFPAAGHPFCPDSLAG